MSLPEKINTPLSDIVVSPTATQPDLVACNQQDNPKVCKSLKYQENGYGIAGLLAGGVSVLGFVFTISMGIDVVNAGQYDIAMVESWNSGQNFLLAASATFGGGAIIPLISRANNISCIRKGKRQNNVFMLSRRARRQVLANANALNAEQGVQLRKGLPSPSCYQGLSHRLYAQLQVDEQRLEYAVFLQHWFQAKQGRKKYWTNEETMGSRQTFENYDQALQCQQQLMYAAAAGEEYMVAASNVAAKYCAPINCAKQRKKLFRQANDQEKNILIDTLTKQLQIVWKPVFADNQIKHEVALNKRTAYLSNQLVQSTVCDYDDLESTFQEFAALATNYNQTMVEQAAVTALQQQEQRKCKQLQPSIEQISEKETKIQQLEEMKLKAYGHI